MLFANFDPRNSFLRLQSFKQRKDQTMEQSNSNATNFPALNDGTGADLPELVSVQQPPRTYISEEAAVAGANLGTVRDDAVPQEKGRYA